MRIATFLLFGSLGCLLLCSLFFSVRANINQGESRKLADSVSQKETRCTFRGKNYLPGEVWHANTSSPHCVLCTCLQSGKLNCTNLECCGDDDEDGDRKNDGGGSSALNMSESNSSIDGGLVRSRSSSSIGVGGGGGGRFSNMSKESLSLLEQIRGATERGERMNACCETCGKRWSPGRAPSPPKTSKEGFGGEDERGKAGSGGSSGTGGGSNSHYYDEETDDDPLVKANLEHVSCLHQGKIYRDREVFAANMSGLPISSRGRDHCMHCVCQGGMVLCNMDPCSGFDCTKNMSSIIMKACCEKCNADRLKALKGLREDDEDVDGRRRGSSNNVNRSPPKPKSAERSADMNDIPDAQYLYKSDHLGEHATPSESSSDQRLIINHPQLAPTKRAGCISAGKFHFHGSTWHPVIGPFGPMECVVCKCLHSRIECSRLPCPSVGELQCSDLVKLEGHCCPTCVLTPAENESREICAPVHQDVTVYKSQEYFPQNDTELIRLSFVRVQENWNPKFQVEVHEWTLEAGRIFRFYTMYYTIEDFIKSNNNKTTGVIVGATTSRNLEKFTKREKKLHFRCKANCNTRIQSLQLTLRLHELVAKHSCSPQERKVW